MAIPGDEQRATEAKSSGPPPIQREAQVTSSARTKVMAAWLVFVGATILAVWTALYLTGSLGPLGFSLTVHLTADGIAGVGAIAFGLAGLGARPGVRPFAFASLGAVTAATGVAASHYIAEGQAAGGAVLGVATAVSLLMLFIGRSPRPLRAPHEGSVQIAYYGLGLALFLMLDASASYLARESWMTAALHGAGFLFLLYGAIFVFRIRRGKAPQ